MATVHSVHNWASAHAATVHHAAVTSVVTDHVVADKAAMARVRSVRMVHLHRSMV
jgi:hypothetical protein